MVFFWRSSMVTDYTIVFVCVSRQRLVLFPIFFTQHLSFLANWLKERIDQNIKNQSLFGDFLVKQVKKDIPKTICLFD